MTDQNTQVPPPVVGGSEANNDKLMGILCYLGILVLIPLLISNKRSPFLNFHVNQGINLVIVWLIGCVIVGFVAQFSYLMSIWQLLMLVMAILGIVNVVKNEMKPLPVIGNLFNLVK